MDQIKSLITPAKFRVWVRHVESRTRDKRDIDTTVGSSYLAGIWDDKAQAYRATRFFVSPEFRDQGFQVDLFKAAMELLSSAHKDLITDGIMTSSHRKYLDQIIHQGHVRKDLPFGNYLLDSPRREITMNKTAQAPRIERGQPQLTRKTEGFIWSMADALARALREPQGSQTGDARFSVSGMSTSSWSIKHPDLEILESGESPLILRIRKVGDGEWRVTGQNQLQNLKNTKVLSVEKTPPVPNHTWDLDYLSKKAADYFIEQKNKIMGLKQTMAPSGSPGAGYEPAPAGGGMEGGMGGGGMPPMASRRARATLANLRQAQAIVAGLGRRYGARGRAQVVNDRLGIGIRVQLADVPQGRLRGSLGGIPVEWRYGNRRIAGSEEPQEETHEKLVNRVYKYLLSRKRPYSSVRYLARILKVDPKRLAKALGELIVQDRIDFTARKFKPVIPPVHPKEDLVAIRSGASVYRTDKGNWKHNDNLDTHLSNEVLTQDAPEEQNNAYSRVLPDPTEPN